MLGYSGVFFTRLAHRGARRGSPLSTRALPAVRRRDGLRRAARLAAALVALSLAGAAGQSAQAQSLLKNGDFEAASPAPWGEWRWAGQCAVAPDTAFVHGGKQSLRFQGVGGCKIGFYQKLGTLPAGRYRLSGFVRAIGLETGQWKRTLMMSLESGEKELFTDNLPAGTYGWRPFSRVYQLDAPGEMVFFTYLFTTGRVWLDDLRLEPVDAGTAPAALSLGPETGSLAAELDAGAGVRCPFCHGVKGDESKPCPFCGFVPERGEGFDFAYYRTEGPNLVRNGDFEEAGEGTKCPFPGWVGRSSLGGEYQFEWAPGRTGKAARITGVKAGRGDIHNLQGFKVKAGEMLRVRFWARSEGLQGGVFVNLEGEPNDNGWQKIPVDSGQTQWRMYETFARVPPGAQGQQEPAILIWFYNFGSGSILFDDISAQVVKPDPAARARAEMARLREFASIAPPPGTAAGVRAALRALAAKIDAAMKEPSPGAVPPLRRATFAALGRLYGGDGSFAVGVAPPLEKVFLDEPYQGGFAPQMRIVLARNESEGAQAVVLSTGKALKGVTLSLGGDLKPVGGSGPALPRSQVQLNVVGYVDTTVGTRPYQSPKLGWWPDPLLPNGSFDVRAGEAQPVLVTVKSTEATRPGRYQGALVVSCGAVKARLPLSVEIFPFALPTRGHYGTFALGSGPDAIAKQYGGDPDERIYERFVAASCEHRLPIVAPLNGWLWDRPKPAKKGESYDWSGLDRWLDALDRQGVTTFPLAVVPRFKKFGGGDYTDKFKKGFVEFVAAYAAHLKEKGLAGRGVLYNIDEASNSLKEWDVCKEIYRLVKAAAPDLPVVQCMNEPNGVRALAGSADIWDLYYGQYDQAGGAERQRAGDGIMLAVCIWPSEHPNLFIEYPLLDARVLPWIGFRAGARGFEYWELFSWGRNIGKSGWLQAGDGTRTAWQLEKPHGDGLLIYPGPNGTPLSSLRFEALRDGMEDYEYLILLRERAKSDPRAAALLKEATEALVTGVTTYDPDPRKLLDLRGRIGRCLASR